MTGPYSSKQFSFKRVGESLLDLGALCDSLSISSGQFEESSQSGDSISELSIKSSKVSLYLLGIAIISDFSSTSPNRLLEYFFQRIVTF